MDQQHTDDEIRAKDKEWEFTSEGKYHLVGRGDIYAVKCPINCFGFEWLINREIKVDGKKFKVIGVERFLHNGPWRKGEAIGLMVHSMDYEIPK